MIAARLSSVWQVAGVAVAALCCYLVSQSVAAERAALGKVDRQIASTQDEITKLNTEISARGRFTQLDAWNGTFGLKAPRPAQYVDSGVQLASLYGHKGEPALALDPAIVASHGAINQVSYTPAAPAPTHHDVPVAAEPDAAPAPQPLLRTATYIRPKTSALEPVDAAPVVTRAAFHVEHAETAKPASSSLLPADIGTLAAAEARGGKARSAKDAR
ncbi:hypothetical protein [Sphingomonas nostoxanthinifaciens]|uniref:hypothetical protein n=1 Tax=Sphingomonas nostoxanthinifaciens TaxID=2872652 RepID=UPI001CC1CB82|nr:hypothetical protein [Sphingomonas nostoxanthinifaciens]UAK24936.1 hypothetical protein K8P63_01595 [Sphingomonas nostoxanthinifaciens]